MKINADEEKDNQISIFLNDNMVSRYILPFYYDADGKGFQNAVKCLENCKFGNDNKFSWEKNDFWHHGEQLVRTFNQGTERETKFVESECDLYDYVKKMISGKENVQNESLGIAFSVDKQVQESVEKLVYYEWRRKKIQYVEFDISDMGIIIFKNGIGFLWYEISFNQNMFDAEATKDGFIPMNIAQIIQDKKFINADFYLKFNNHFKELNPWTQRSRLQQRTNSVRFMLKSQFNELMNSDLDYYFQNHLSYFFCLGIYFQKLLDQCFNTRAEVGSINAKYFHLSKNHHLEEAVAAEYREYQYIPDKPILFQYQLCYGYGFDENEQKQIEINKSQFLDMAIWMNNGMNKGYLIGEQYEQSVVNPFKNAYFCANEEGAGYYAIDDGNEFFRKRHPHKIKGDYFCIYMLVLYRSYSVILYNMEISKLSASVRDYQSGKEQYQKLKKLSLAINVFLTRSLFGKISYLSHQNVFYEFCKKQLNLEEDISSLTAGLETLKQMEQEYIEQQSEVRNKVWTILLAILAVASAVSDGIAAVDRIVFGGEQTIKFPFGMHCDNIWYDIVLIVALLPFLCLLVYGIQAGLLNLKKRCGVNKKKY